MPSELECDPQVGAPSKRPYRPSWLIFLSVILHGLGLLMLIWQVSSWPVVIGVLLIVHLMLTLVGLWPRSTLLGPNTIRLSQGPSDLVYLTFDDGPNPKLTPQVLDLLDQYHCLATFFVIGQHVREYPDLTREILRRGHAIGNHSDTHGYTFAMHSVRGYTEELETSQQAIFDATGTWPRYFRAPFGFRSPLLEPALCRTGLHLMSWTRRGFDTRCRSPRKVLKRLTQNLTCGDILLLHDGPYGLDQAEGAMVLQVLPDLLSFLQQKGLRSAVVPNAFATDN